jgi:hypothetical protein
MQHLFQCFKFRILKFKDQQRIPQKPNKMLPIHKSNLTKKENLIHTIIKMKIENIVLTKISKSQKGQILCQFNYTILIT